LRQNQYYFLLKFGGEAELKIANSRTHKTIRKNLDLHILYIQT